MDVPSLEGDGENRTRTLDILREDLSWIPSSLIDEFAKTIIDIEALPVNS